jgi:predicted DNA-binding transcriptional regulator AlpA
MTATLTPSRWLDPAEAASHVGLRELEFLRRVKAAKLPAPSYALGPRTPRWDRMALDQAMTGAAPSRRPLAGAVNAILAEGREKAASLRR